MFRLSYPRMAAWAALTLAAISVNAIATAPAVTVRFNDLDLRQTQDISLLYQRLERASDQVCGEREWPGSRVSAAAYDRCVARALNDAVARVDHAALSAYHRNHNGISTREATVARR